VVDRLKAERILEKENGDTKEDQMIKMKAIKQTKANLKELRKAAG